MKFLKILALAAVVTVAVTAAVAEEALDTFEIACPSLDAAIAYITLVDYNGCFVFAERFGFEPWGHLTPMAEANDMTLYFVQWDDGSKGMYAVK